MTESKAEVRKKVEDILVKNVIAGFAKKVAVVTKPGEPGPRDIIFTGSLEGVNDFFYDRLWTDGLPIIPPTIEKVEEFLKFTDRSPDEVIGVLAPEKRQATVWNVAVNGVMAGCRPEYMPVLIAVVAAISEPEFRIEDAGSTPGWEPLVILNGTIIKELDFNCGSGVMRVGRRANTSIGRFLRLYMINVAGLRIPPGQTDKGTIAMTFNVALAENEDAVTELGWQSFSADRGFSPGENVATVQSVVVISAPIYSAGNSPQEVLEAIVETFGRGAQAFRTFSAAMHGESHPLLVMSPSVAKVIAKAGWTKDNIRQHLYEKAEAPAAYLEKLGRQVGLTSSSFCAAVAEGIAPKQFCESADPDRMVPVFLRPDTIGIVVSGDPGRNQSRGYVQNHTQGPPVSKRIELPRHWQPLLREAIRTRGKATR